jgi:arylsulfatase A-like enzyme
MTSRTSRREFITAAGLGFLGLTRASLAQAAESKRKPNIVFIITDQQHAGMLSCTGNPYLKTPAMDRLAASGMRFERAYTTNPVCLPARYSFFTGQMPSTVGITLNEDGQRGVPEGVPKRAMGWALRDAGYETAYGGKVHLPKGMAPGNIGFKALTRDSRQELANVCSEFIKGPHEKPFALVASFINPHDICYMAINDHHRSEGRSPVDNLDSRICEGLIEKPRKNLSEFVEAHCPPLPANFEVPELEPECITESYLKARTFREYAREAWSDEMWRLHRWAYCRLTEMVDAKVGKVLAAVREAGIGDNTLIVFTSDHGDHDSAHRLEHKSMLYEESARVPFVLSLPGIIPAGVVDKTHLVSTGLDIFPTLCDYAGVAPREDLQGRSLRQLAEGKPVADWRDHLIAESQDGRMVRTRRFKYCVYGPGKHREQLVDLQNDPGEMKNLAYDESHKDVLQQHRTLLAGWVRQTGDTLGQAYVVNS